MPDFSFPGDCKSLPAFRLFEASFLQGAGPGHPAQPTHPLFVYTTLKLILSYQVATSDPGFLSDQAAGLLRLDLLEANVDPALALSSLDGTVLRKVDGGWMDDQFAQANADLSPKHRRAVDRGAAHSAIKRNRKNIETLASQQQFLIPAESFLDHAGNRIDAALTRKVLLLVHTLDKCLGRPTRHNSDFTPGLIADAVAALSLWPDHWTDDDRQKFGYWVNDLRGDSRLHQSTDLILAHFKEVLEMYELQQEVATR